MGCQTPKVENHWFRQVGTSPLFYHFRQDQTKFLDKLERFFELFGSTILCCHFNFQSSHLLLVSQILVWFEEKFDLFHHSFSTPKNPTKASSIPNNIIKDIRTRSSHIYVVYFNLVQVPKIEGYHGPKSAAADFAARREPETFRQRRVQSEARSAVQA